MIAVAFWDSGLSLPPCVYVVAGNSSYAIEVGEHGANGWIIYCGY